MIITRTPFRISFCGGGSDLPSFYKKHGGCVISTGIDKYMYISIHPAFDSNMTILKYSQTETVTSYDRIKHQYFKSVLSRLGISGVEISSTADIPSGTGLGSSSSFTVGLLHAIYSYQGKFKSKEQLAEEACRTEIIDLKQPIGKQDQYAAACGGLNFYTFNRDGSVFVDPVIMPNESFEKLKKNLMLFYTGDVRSASNILKEQKENVTSGERENNQKKMCELARDLKKQLENDKYQSMGEILHENWQLKRTLAAGITNPQIDEYYEEARKNGALGGKLLGAGGGGFLLFYVPQNHQQAVRESIPLSEMPFDFDMHGSTVIYVGKNPNRICK